MTKSEKGTGTNQGIGRAGAWCLGMLWMITAGIGITTVFSENPGSPVTGWLFLLFSALLFMVTMDRWVSILPGLLGYGVFGAILATASGHGLNRPDLPISLREGILLISFFGLSAIISYTFTRRKLRIIDRAALLAFAASLFRVMLDDSITVTGLGIPITSLIVAWVFDRYSNRSPIRKLARER